MVYKVLITYLIGVSSQNFYKCSDGDPKACGSNAVCIDGKYEYSEAYCSCLKEYYGPPPNCTRVCESDCKSNEYCDLDEEICKEGCRLNADCKESEDCENNICVKKKLEVFFSDSDCESDKSKTAISLKSAMVLSGRLESESSLPDYGDDYL